MLRRRLGDERFMKMLAELRRRYEFRSISTEDLRALAKEFVPPKTSPDSIDSFFENWVYSTGVPSVETEICGEGRGAGRENFGHGDANRRRRRFFRRGSRGDSVRQGSAADHLGADLQRRRNLHRDRPPGAVARGAARQCPRPEIRFIRAVCGIARRSATKSSRRKPPAPPSAATALRPPRPAGKRRARFP